MIHLFQDFDQSMSARLAGRNLIRKGKLVLVTLPHRSRYAVSKQTKRPTLSRWTFQIEYKMYSTGATGLVRPRVYGRLCSSQTDWDVDSACAICKFIYEYYAPFQSDVHPDPLVCSRNTSILASVNDVSSSYSKAEELSLYEITKPMKGCE